MVHYASALIPQAAGAHRLSITATDVDLKCVHMAFLQLSLLNIPAVVVHGNSLSLEEYSHWFTPAHILNGWDHKLRHRAELETPPVREPESLPPIKAPMIAPSLAIPTLPVYIDISSETDLSGLNSGALLAAFGLHLTRLSSGGSLDESEKNALEAAQRRIEEFAFGKTTRTWVPDGYDDYYDHEPGHYLTYAPRRLAV